MNRGLTLSLRLGVASAVLAVTAIAAELPATYQGATPLEWSQRLARAEMARRGTTLCFRGAEKARWDYTAGLFSYALLRLGAQAGDQPMADYGARIVESYVQPDGTIATYRLDEFNLDMVTPGRALQLRYEQTGAPRLKVALATLRGQLARQPRTSEGGFWHKQRYPGQMWLDGVYMASPFLAHAGKAEGDPAAFDEVARQLLLIDRHLYDAKTGLFYHAWDENRAQAWADRATGRSPNFWGRSVGWYAMALVDCLDDLPPTHPEVEAIGDILRRLAAGLVRWQDPASGLWWQVLDQGGRPGNYLESSASSMFVYALAKGVNRGYLPREPYAAAAAKAYAGLVRDCLRTDAGGRRPDSAIEPGHAEGECRSDAPEPLRPAPRDHCHRGARARLPVLGGGQGGPTQVAFRCGFEQVLKDQRCLGLVEKPDARPFDGEGGGGMFSHRGERLLRVSAMNGRVLGQLVEDRLLRCELPQTELFDFLSLLLVRDVFRDAQKVPWHAGVVVQREFLGMEPTQPVILRLDRFGRNVQHGAPRQRFAIPRGEKFRLFPREEVEIVLSQERFTREAGQLLARFVELDVSQLQRVFQKDHMRDVFDDRFEELACMG